MDVVENFKFLKLLKGYASFKDENTILGAGYVRLEIAMAYNRLGVKIRIIEFSERVLRKVLHHKWKWKGLNSYPMSGLRSLKKMMGKRFLSVENPIWKRCIKIELLCKLNMNADKINNVILAIKISLLVGTILVLINHYDMFLEQKFTRERILKVILTYIAPFCVSLYSSTCGKNT